MKPCPQLWFLGNMVMMVLLSQPVLARSEAAKDFYVSPRGSDSNPGTKAKPFATLQRARDAIRGARRNGPLPIGGISVWVRAGNYPLSHTLKLTAEDSGTPEAPIVYRAYPGEEVRLTGGKQVTGFVPVTDETILQRIDSLYRGKILQVNLKAQGITDFGRLSPRGFGMPPQPSALEVFFQDRPMTLARWPNQGFVKIVTVPDAGTIVDIHAPGSKAGRLTYAEDRPKRWGEKPEDVWLHGYWRYDWADSYVKVESIDAQKREIVIQAPQSTYGYAPGQTYYYLNVLEELDQPGEWCLDRRSGILYFWPPASLEQGKVSVSLLNEPLVSPQEASYLTLQGFILENTRGNGVEIKGGSHNLIAGCTLRNLGNLAVAVQGGTQHGVLSCDIYETGDGGVRLEGGDRGTLTPAGHYARNNHIHHFSRWCRTYQPALQITGVGNLATHNLIHDAPHNAIQLTGNDHLIELNEIHHVCLETQDVGAFYLGRNWTERGNRVRHNFFHHIGEVGRDVRGVYLDDCASGTMVFGNIFYRVTRAVIIGGGRDNQIKNNIFVQCDPALRLDERCMGTKEVWRGIVYGEMKRSLEEVQTQQALYNSRYPELVGVYKYYEEKSGVPPEGNSIVQNISFGGTWLLDHPDYKVDQTLFGIRDNLIDQDPGFVDAPHMNFQLKQDSPAFKLGFEPIPREKIGLYKDEHRKQLLK